jgi:hypothetical protein
MNCKSLRFTVLFAAIAGSAFAHTCNGGKPDSTQSIEVDGQPGNVLMIESK